MGIGGSGRKVWSPKQGSGAAEKLPAALGGARLAAKRGRAAAAVCAKFWVAREGAGEGHGAEPRKLWSPPKGDLREPHSESPRLGQVAFACPTPARAGLTRVLFNPSRLGGKELHPGRGGWTQVGWTTSRLPAQSFCGLGAFPCSFRVFCSLLSTSVCRTQASCWASFPQSVILPLAPRGRVFSVSPLSSAL